MKIVKVIVSCLLIAFAFQGFTNSLKAEESVSLENETFPSVQEYKVDADNKEWKIDDTTRIFVLKDGTQNNTHFMEVVKLMDSEFATKAIPTSKPMQIVCGEQNQIQKGDIVVSLGSVKESSSDEAYTINIKDSIKLVANSGDGALYGLRTIMNYMITKGEMPYGNIVDYPDLQERCFHIDIARKFYPKEWIIAQIKEMSLMHYNTLQLHFSENEGFRIQCDSDPAIVSTDTSNKVGEDQPVIDPTTGKEKTYLTKEEVREIIDTAHTYGIDVIPALDSPSHMLHILNVHPEFRLQLPSGSGYNKTQMDSDLDFGNENARNYVKKLYKEYGELFYDSKYFSIGGDEYKALSVFDKSDSLKAYAKEIAGSDDPTKATADTAYVGYINEMSSYVKEMGFIPRVWNDGVFTRDMDGNTKPCSVDLDKDVIIEFWSGCRVHMNSLDYFLEKDRKVMNFFDDDFYYVLNHSPYAYPTGENIFNNWKTNQFAPVSQADGFNDDVGRNVNGRVPQYLSSEYEDQYLGTAFSIWSSQGTYESRTHVQEGIFEPMRALAQKSWNRGSDKETRSGNEQTYAQLKTVFDKLGHAVGFYYENGADNNFDARGNMVDATVAPSEVIYLEDSSSHDESQTTTTTTIKNNDVPKGEPQPNNKSNELGDNKLEGKKDKVTKETTKSNVPTGDTSNNVLFVELLIGSLIVIIYMKRQTVK